MAFYHQKRPWGEGGSGGIFLIIQGFNGKIQHHRVFLGGFGDLIPAIHPILWSDRDKITNFGDYESRFLISILTCSIWAENMGFESNNFWVISSIHEIHQLLVFHLFIGDPFDWRNLKRSGRDDHFCCPLFGWDGSFSGLVSIIFDSKCHDVHDVHGWVSKAILMKSSCCLVKLLNQHSSWLKHDMIVSCLHPYDHCLYHPGSEALFYRNQIASNSCLFKMGHHISSLVSQPEWPLAWQLENSPMTWETPKSPVFRSRWIANG